MRAESEQAICAENIVCGMVEEIRAPERPNPDRRLPFQTQRPHGVRVMSSTPPPKGNIKGFRAFVRKVLAYEPPPKAPQEPPPPKARHRTPAKKKDSRVPVS